MSARRRQRATDPVEGRRRVDTKPLTRPSLPWGTIAAGTVLALALGGVLSYAALNQGDGYRDPVQRADESVPGVQVVDTAGVDAAHTDQPVDYGTDQPPVAGQMASATARCGTAFPTQPPTEQVMHSMEHGAVWSTYRPDLSKEDVTQLTMTAPGARSSSAPLKG